MPLTEAIVLNVGAAVAKSIVQLWIKDIPLVDDASSSLIDLLKSRTSDTIAQRRGQRQFDIIGEKIGESLLPLFESEGTKLDDGARTSIAMAVTEAFNKSKISSRLLAEYNLEPSKLVRHVLNAHPNAPHYFTADELAFYVRVIQEACGYIIDIASQLPTFNERTFAEILKKENQILEKAEEIVNAIRRIQDLQNAVTQVGKFEVDYRLAILRKLDVLQLFGVTASLESRQHHLISNYITLAVEQQATSLQEKQTWLSLA